MVGCNKNIAPLIRFSRKYYPKNVSRKGSRVLFETKLCLQVFTIIKKDGLSGLFLK
jgi:hypothetical protein